MHKKYLFGSLIGLLGILGIWQLAANAQTWSGPKPGCYDPSQTDCNVDGVIWNRKNFDTAPSQQGNYKIDGRAQLGSDLRVGGDFYFTSNSKAFRVDKTGSAGILNIGNWNSDNLGSEQPVEVNILGNLNLINNDAFNDPKINAPKICLAGDCRIAWPVGGGGGEGTVTSVGSGNGLTGGPIVGAGALSIISCGEGKILKTIGGVWVCADDADTNSGGTITTVSSPDTSLNVTNGAGPVTNLSINQTWTNDRYVNVSGDTMSGTLNITPGAGYGLHVNSGGIRVENGGITNIGDMQNYGQLQVNSAGTAISAYGSGYGAILAGGVNGLYAGSDTNGAGAYLFYQTVPNGPITKSVTLAGKDYAMDVWGGDTRFQNNVTVTGGGKITSGTFCIGADCRNSWPVAGTGDVTDVNAGTGITVTNPLGPSPSVALNTVYTDGLYVNTGGDIMTGSLTLSGAASNLVVGGNSTINGNAIVPNNNWGDGTNTVSSTLGPDGTTWNSYNPAPIANGQCYYHNSLAIGNWLHCPRGTYAAGVQMGNTNNTVAGITYNLMCCKL
ncbi:MAG: hypothetical protein WC750_02170 [Patescibacteria group bacterium]|jgi:hypothetical protein